jgi:hypothetical protein
MIVISRSLWAGFFARIGRAGRKFLENVPLEDTEDVRMYSGGGCITENFRHNSTAQTVHSFVVNLEL